MAPLIRRGLLAVMKTPPAHWSEPLSSPPLLDWDELEILLFDIVVIPARRRFVTPGLAGVAKQARFLPPLEVWRQIAILIWIVLDETPLVIEPESLDGEAPMP